MRSVPFSMIVAIVGAVAVAACQGGQPPIVVTPPPTLATASPAAVASPPPVVVAVASPTVPPVAAAPSPVAPAASPVAALPAASPSPVACQILLGFAAMRDLIGASTVGECMENERYIAGNGNTEQRTTNGLLVYRALDQRVLLVGASQTWINRDGATVVRPNDQRFEWEGDRQLVESLRKGGYILYIRHGATDPNQRDSDPDNLANCATQRNLTDAGRQQGRTVGEALRALNIPVGQLLSSEYCRAQEFARLLFNREAEVEPSLVLPDPLTEDQRARNTEALKRVMARPPQAGTNTFLVSHSPNIRLAAGVDLPDEGGTAVFRLAGDTPQLVARVLPGEWPAWASAMGIR